MMNANGLYDGYYNDNGKCYDCMKWLSATLIRGLGVETMSGPGLYVNHIHISAVGQLQRGTDLFEVLENDVEQHLSYQPLT